MGKESGDKSIRRIKLLDNPRPCPREHQGSTTHLFIQLERCAFHLLSQRHSTQCTRIKTVLFKVPPEPHILPFQNEHPRDHTPNNGKRTPNQENALLPFLSTTQATLDRREYLLNFSRSALRFSGGARESRDNVSGLLNKSMMGWWNTDLRSNRRTCFTRCCSKAHEMAAQGRWEGF